MKWNEIRKRKWTIKILAFSLRPMPMKIWSKLLPFIITIVKNYYKRKGIYNS